MPCRHLGDRSRQPTGDPVVLHRHDAGGALRRVDDRLNVDRRDRVQLDDARGDVRRLLAPEGVPPEPEWFSAEMLSDPRARELAGRVQLIADEEVRTKFMALAEPVVGASAASFVMEIVDDLESLDRVGTLTACLRGSTIV